MIAVIFYLQHAVNGQNYPSRAITECVFLQSKNYPHHYFGLKGIQGYITEYDNARAYRIVPGLIGKGVSFQSCAHPNKYLRHRNYKIEESKYERAPLFKKDASFIMHENYFFPGYKTFESVNYPHHFIRHFGYALRIDRGSTELFRNDASFQHICN